MMCGPNRKEDDRRSNRRKRVLAGDQAHRMAPRACMVKSSCRQGNASKL